MGDQCVAPAHRGWDPTWDILSSVLWKIILCAVIMQVWNSVALQVVKLIISNTVYDDLGVSLANSVISVIKF